jgi:hypothetical protein
MSIIKKTLFVFVTGVFTMVFAQKVNSNAKNILDVVSAHYKSKNAIYFKFIYATAGKNEMGEFYASKDKYRLKIMGSEQIFDGNKIYSINEEEQEVTVSKSNGGENVLSPMSYLEAYKKNYNIIYVSKKNNQDIIKLTPIKNNKIKQVLLYINFAKKQIEKVEQYTVNNAKTSIIISQYKENIAVSSSVFSFNKNQYKNYLITEL